jgi:hypothetical protein
MNPINYFRRWLRCAVAALLVLSSFTLNAAPPSNDNFAASTLLTGASGTRSGTNLEATGQLNEPDHGGGSSGFSVWYRWVAPSSGVFVFDTEGSDFDSVLAIYTGGNLAGLVEVGSAFGDVFFDEPAKVFFTATAGTTYRIAVDGWSGDTGEEGNIVLNWKLSPGPVNDFFSAARVITGAGGSVDATNAAATKEVGEPDHAGDAGGASVWYEWTAPGNGSASFAAEGSYSGIVAVYTGGSLATLVEVASGLGVVGFPATQGVVYKIAIDGEGGDVGGGQLEWSLLGDHNNFANALVLTGGEGTRADTNEGANAEANEPEHGGASAGSRATMWYRWTAPASGLVRFGAEHRVGFGDFGVNRFVVAVYTGSSLNALTLVTQSGETNGFQNDAVIFPATAGTEYRIAVDSPFFNDGGLFTLSWVQAGPPSNDSLANAQVLAGAAGQVSAVMIGSTLESGESVGGENYGSVFYRFTAPAAGVFSMNLAVGEFGQTVIEVKAVEGSGANLFAPLNGTGRVGVAAGDVVTVSVAADPYQYPKFNLSYQFSSGVSLFDQTMDESIFLERTGQTGALTVTRTGATSRTASVAIIPKTGTGFAEQGTHFTLSEATLNFAVGETQKVVTVSMLNNTATEGPLRLSLELGPVSNAVVQPQLVVATRFDDEDDPANNRIVNATELSGASGTMAATTVGADPEFDTDPGYIETEESFGPLQFKAAETVWYRWTAPAAGPIAFKAEQFADVQYEIVLAVFDGTARTANLIASGEGNGGFDEAVIAQTAWVAEAGQTYYVAVAAYNVSAVSSVGIPFDLSWSSPAAGLVSVADVTVTEGMDANAVVTISRTNGAAAFDVEFEVFPDGGTAVEGEDFTAVTQTVSFGAGETSKTVSVPILNDTLTEDAELGLLGETFTVGISSESADVFIERSPARVTILDDEAGGIVSLDPAGDDLETAMEDSGAFGVRVIRQGITSGSSTVSFAVTAGTATADDATLVSGTVTFAAGETEKFISIPITDDTLDEPNETLTLTLSSPGAGTTLGQKATAVLTIVDDDIPGVLAFSAATLSVAEDAAAATLTVARTIGSDGAVSASFAVTAGTAGDGDVSLAGGTVSFAHGETSKTISVPLNDDFIDEVDETFTVTLSAPTAGASIGTQAGTVVTIVDDDIPGVLAFPSSAAVIPEDNETFNLFVGRTVGTDGPVSVSYTVVAETAVPGVHFIAASGTLNFAHGEANKAVLFQILNNEFDEEDVTLTVTLSAPTNGASLGAISSVAMTITDNDTFAAENTLFSAPLMQAGVMKGLLTLKTTSTGKVTAQALIGAVKYSFAGTLAADGRATLVVKKRDEADKTLAFHIGGSQVVGTLNDGQGNLYTIDGAEKDTGTKAAPVAMAGNYTAVIKTDAAPNGGLPANTFPQGRGWISVKVAADGKTKLNGKLADGTTLTFGGALNANDALPVFAPLYAKKSGSVGFTLVFDFEQTATDVTAENVRWVRPLNLKDKGYPAGWPAGISAQLEGSKFVVPAKPSVKNPTPVYVLGTHNLVGLIAPAAAQITLSEGGLANVLANNVTVNAKSVVTVGLPAGGFSGATGLAMKLKPSGEFSGAFIHPLNNKQAKFSGVVLQKTFGASGFFVSPFGKSGAIDMLSE